MENVARQPAAGAEFRLRDSVLYFIGKSSSFLMKSIFNLLLETREYVGE